MPKISKYLSDLLYYNDCVILPGFGGFISSYKPAEVLHGNGSLIPPCKVVAFNMHLREDDGLITDYIRRVSGITYEEAILVISDFVENAYVELGTKSRFDLPGVGFFHISNENRLVFNPDNSMNFLPESFGLSSFHFPVIDVSPTIKRRQKERAKKEAIYGNARGKTIRRIIVATPIIAALAIIPFYSHLVESINLSGINPFNTGNKRMEITEKRAVNTVINNPEDLEFAIDYITAKKNALYYSEPDTLSNEGLEAIRMKVGFPELNLDTVAVVDVPEQETVQPVSSLKNPETKSGQESPFKFHVIAGSFVDYESAEKSLAQLKQQGFTPVILQADKGRIRISIMGSDNRDEAIKKIDSLKNSGSISVWLLTR
ncbi:MAG: hypothetical protein A2W91_12450 [Bacteroidetes bacterium GWF2_38_335]|nr:MAG: hypothetical protein A2W91_12450 [Bacteroidetes bacterium GWF2_38_335]OFY76979.1 MAG: hypothetical protein A2281_00565 [Bacteroidetes bacterium RIFOXYA12_FULL_38_20]HBS86834.1 hypothetical protein [Bacteroidales bacterium]